MPSRDVNDAKEIAAIRKQLANIAASANAKRIGLIFSIEVIEKAIPGSQVYINPFKPRFHAFEVVLRPLPESLVDPVL
eukprot:jgi/Hompol1/4571/HPOL_003712-RA